MSDSGTDRTIPRHVVVIGADAAGMSAAHQALRRARSLGRTLRITALEATEHTSYSACGLPYWIGGQVPSGDDLVARHPDEHREAGIDLRTGVRAHTVDLQARTVEAVDAAGTALTFDYDDLVIATGAAPRIPAWASDEHGGLVPGVAPVKTLDDGAAWHALLEGRAGQAAPLRVAVVGAGYIGVEMAEALLDRGCEVDLYAADEVLPGFETPVRQRMTAVLRAAGVRVHEHARVDSLVRDAEGVLRGVRHPGGGSDADLVVVATGVDPRSDLTVRGGDLPRGAAGAFDPDDRQRLAPHVWTAGDCSTVRHRMTGSRVFIPLGTHANKQGRVLGDNLAGGASRSEGALGTAITRFRHGSHLLEVARTGLGTTEAADAGFQPTALLTEGSVISGYMPGAATAAVWVCADTRTRRLLGVQIAGGEGAAKRIDTAAVVLWAGGSVDDLAAVDLAYAPPFATVWDVVQIAARRLAERI